MYSSGASIANCVCLYVSECVCVHFCCIFLLVLISLILSSLLCFRFHPCFHGVTIKLLSTQSNCCAELYSNNSNNSNNSNTTYNSNNSDSKWNMFFIDILSI